MIFTLTLWVLAIFLIYSGLGNKTNKWVAYCLIIASIGTLKEYLNEKLVPVLIKLYPGISSELYVTINSCLIAVLYLLLPLCFITMSMYFAGYDDCDKKVILLVQFSTVILISILLIIYCPLYFKHYQLHRRDFWYVMSAYNISYSMAGFIIMHRGIKNESDEKIRRTKRIIIKVFVVPYFFWLFSIFIIHTLDLDWLKKVWKYNEFVVLAVLLFYAYMAYKEGIMGLKVSLVKYDWNSKMESVNSNMQYINHLLKNQVTKINWSVESLRKKLGDKQMVELDIIERSIKQLVNFTEKANKCLAPKMAGNDLCSASNMINDALEAFKPLQKREIRLYVNLREDVHIKCDGQAVVEVIYNLIKNSSEAVTGNGKIEVSAYKKSEFYCIEICDDGVGISREDMEKLFLPFFTTKKNNINFGIGLPYCKAVMEAHDGSIQVFSQKGLTRFILCFPIKRIRRKEVG